MRKKDKNRTAKKAKKPLQEYTGKVQMTREGFVFVIVEGLEEDIFVKPSQTRRALNSDIVRVVVTKDSLQSQGRKKAPKKAQQSKQSQQSQQSQQSKQSQQAQQSKQTQQNRRMEGEIIEIVQRSVKPWVGIYHTVGAQAWVLMQSRNMPYDIEVDAEQATKMGAQVGMKVAVMVDDWKRGDHTPYGHLIDVLGQPGENDTEMHAILTEFNLPYRFDAEVENEADTISEAISPEEIKRRFDFRNTLTFTIDPSDAKDFDDALSFRRLGNGNFEVGVHIADVSHYVRPGSLVDKEARFRGTSVYLVDRTVPMLPEKLCNRLCSLRPNEDKLVFSVIFEITPKAAVKSRRITKGVIRSDFRLDYEQAQDIIESDSGNAKANSQIELSQNPLPKTSPEITDAILTLNKLAILLRRKGLQAGAIDFERPELKVVVDAQGKPIDVYEKLPKESHSLIEQFMLLANRTVAEFIATSGKMNGVPDKKAVPFVYRIHGEPNEIKLDGLRLFAKNFGYKFDSEKAFEGREAAHSLNKLLSQAKGTPEFMALETLALRSMAKACYSTDNIGHYGLAFKFYTHFTSPIRRYPDLMVHRILADYLQKKDTAAKNYLENECRYASEREQIAADAERTSIKYKLVEFMQDKIDQEFDARISGLTQWGMYAELEDTKIEGMIALREIRSDFFEFDEKSYRLIGKRTKTQYRLGDKVRIRVKSANLEQRLLDYELVE